MYSGESFGYMVANNKVNCPVSGGEFMLYCLEWQIVRYTVVNYAVYSGEL